ncbi:hypothetical protein [Fodinicola acaciae]|uniref:hypothetical protein n=1 Tax=Fodinicola acaciae TaxID=2681555 RepID=UPI0013D52CD6|nr:hypothetical protein [Fodinicola acaciae]
MRHPVRSILLGAVTAAVLVGAAATPVSAAEVLYDTVSPASSYRAPEEGADYAAYPLAAISINVAAGQRTYVSGVLAFASSTVGSIVDTSVQCKNGTNDAGKVVHGENIGTNYEPSAAISGRLLATSATSGTLVCTLYAYAHSLATAATRFSITSGHIEVGSRSVPGGVQAASTQQLASVGSPVWTPRIVGTESLPGHSNLWRAPAGSTSLNVFADQSITACKTSGDSVYGCPSGTTGSSSAVHTTLYATQFTSTGGVCRTSTYAVSRIVTTTLHHDVFYHNIPTVPVLASGGCVPVFSIYLKIEVSSGQDAVANDAAPTGEMGVLFVLPT